MANDKQVQVFGDGTKDTNLSNVGTCGGCASYSGADAPFVFTPINFSYKIKAKYTYAKNGSENNLALTPNGDMYVEYNLMSIEGINKGAIGKNAAEELKEYYNGTLAKGGGTEEMTTDFANKVITEFHTELSKEKWKTFFQKAIKNSIKTENLLKSTFQDYINHNFITNTNRKAISYKGWNGNSVEKTYSVKVNVGVKPKFLKSCTIEDDKSRLTLTKPEKKFCKAFLAVTGEDKELSDDNFLFEVTDQYSEPTARGFDAETTLGKLEDLNEKLITPASMAQIKKDYDKLAKDGAFAGFAALASGGGGLLQFDGETRALSLGIQHGGTRIQVESDMSGTQVKEDIYFRVELGIGPNGDVGVTKVAIGGRKASLAHALDVIARNWQGWMYQVWQSWSKPNDPSTLTKVEKAEDDAEKVVDKTEELKNKTETLEDKVADNAGAVAGATPETASAVAQQLGSVKAAAVDANTAAIAAQTAQTTLSTPVGSNPLTSNTNNQNINKVVTETQQTIQHLDTAIENLGNVPANIPAAQAEYTAAVNKSVTADISAGVAQAKATEVKSDVTGLVDVVEKLTSIAGNGNDLPEGEKSMLNTFGSKLEEAKTVVKTITADNNKTVPEDLVDKLGGQLVPEGSNNGTIPKSFTDRSNLQSETRVESNDNTKGNSSFIYKNEATETPNPLSTIGSNEGEGFKSDKNEGWSKPENEGVLEFQIKKADADHPAQNGKMSE